MSVSISGGESEGRRSDVLGADGMESGTVAGLVIPFSGVVTHIHAVLALAPVRLTRVPVGEPLIHTRVILGPPENEMIVSCIVSSAVKMKRDVSGFGTYLPFEWEEWYKM